MRKRAGIATAAGIFTLIMMFILYINVYAAFQYEHDPMDNPKAAADIIEDENAVYGYSPNPDSARLGAYASYDWSDEEIVAPARESRIAYHQKNEELYQIIRDMTEEGKSTEEIARAVSTRRNELRLEAYKDDPEGLETVRKSNLETYGHEEGPLPEELYEKYGSWDTVIEKAISSNPGMDACLGLYDQYYDTYGIIDDSEDGGAETTDDNSETGEEDTGADTIENPEKVSPKTGDSEGMLFVIALLILISGATAGCIYAANRA